MVFTDAELQALLLNDLEAYELALREPRQPGDAVVVHLLTGNPPHLHNDNDHA